MPHPLRTSENYLAVAAGPQGILQFDGACNKVLHRGLRASVPLIKIGDEVAGKSLRDGMERKDNGQLRTGIFGQALLSRSRDEVLSVAEIRTGRGKQALGVQGIGATK